MVYFVFAILIILVAVSLARGYTLAELWKMSLPGFRDALIVVEVLALIGCLTGLWRSSGTIAYFITAGIHVLPPSLFILSAFLLTALMSLAIGASFGVVATAGVILMSIARAGDINLFLVAGAIMSGIYVGDRNSPAASSAALVAAVTRTDLNKNLGLMLRTSLLPLLFCTIAYALLSFLSPMQQVNAAALTLLEENFTLHILCILPALIMVVLPLCRIKVKTSMVLDILLSFLLAIFVQKESFPRVLSAMVLGYRAEDATLAHLLNGGGMKSMFSVCIILLVSGCFSEIMKGTGLLDKVYEKIAAMRGRIGRFGAMIVLSTVSCMLFCNQTIGVMMVNQLSSGLYTKEEKYRKMLDIEDSVIVIAGLVPWCIASSVPLATLGVGPAALLCSSYLYLLPICRLIVPVEKLIPVFPAEEA